MTSKQRKEAESLIYSFFDKLDKKYKYNSEHYKKMFAKMTDAQFLKFISKEFPYRFYQKPFEVEPSLSDAFDACKVLGVPVMETVYQPYLYMDDKGNPVETEEEELVVYLPLKKMQQFLTHKNSMSINTDDRNMKTGELLGKDKNGKTSDRELQSLIVLGLDKTTDEFSRSKGDAMDAKNKMYATIATKGEVSEEDIKSDSDDSLSRNMLNTYFIGANIKSNIINDSYLLPYTLKHEKMRGIRKV